MERLGEDLTLLRRRLRLLIVVSAGLLGIGLLRVWSLQVLKSDYYQGLSESNRIRTVMLPAPRGFIYDRAGRLLANNVPSFNLYLVLEDVRDTDGLIQTLGHWVEMDPEEVKRRIRTARRTVPYLPVKIKEGLTLREVVGVESHQSEMPGILLEPEPQRNYLYGRLAGHVLGHVGEISDAQLRDPEYGSVLPGQIVGQYGVEHSHDEVLRGRVGQKWIEVNALGHEVKVLKVEDPQPGDDLYLTLDLRIQQTAEEALGSEAGTVVALDPRTGELLAMVSHPSFDPNLLSRGLTPAAWNAIVQDPDHPLTHRAIQGQYPPGSVFKIVVAAAALETGETNPSAQILCRGRYPFGQRIFWDWKKPGHGQMDLHTAIVQSCDVYFYEMGRRLGPDRVADYSRRFGLGMPTGIELLSEKSGNIPTTQWKKQVIGEPWYPGESLMVGIGQGYITTTPLQLAHLIGAVSNGGERYRPHLVKSVQRRATGQEELYPPVRIGRVEVQPQTIRLVRKALEGVVMEPHGTGMAARSKRVTVAGKTGTAQVVENQEGQDNKNQPKQLRDHAWFVAFAPAEEGRPAEIAVAVLVEHGGKGGEAAAPIARKVIEAYLDQKTADPS
jgi:penicillin-binding protein 2